MSTENKPAGQRMPARPSGEEGGGKVIFGVLAAVAILFSARGFYLMNVELHASYPDKSRAFLMAIVGLGSLIGAMVCLYNVGSQSQWRNYANQAESQFAELQEAHHALLGETAEYRTAYAAAAKKLNAKQQAEREATTAGVVKDVVAYQHGAVPDDNDKPAS